MLANTYPPIRLHCDLCRRQVDELFSTWIFGKRYWLCKRCNEAIKEAVVGKDNEKTA